MKWEEFSAKLHDRCRQMRVPYHASFELTPYCNFDCNMCYIHLTPKQAAAQGRVLSTEQWLDLTAQAKNMGIIELEVTGGEAATRSDFPVLYEAFIKAGFLVTLRSNGYLLSGSIIDLLKKYKPRAISITLYGSSDATYKKVCGISDGFSVVSRNIVSLVENGLPPKLSMTLTRDNQEDYKELKEWTNKHGLSVRPYGRLFTPFQNTNRSIADLQVDYFSKEPEYDSDLITTPRKIDRTNHHYEKPFWMCRGYGSIFSVSWDGRIKICNGFEGVSKDILSSNLKEAYLALYAELDQIKRPEKCAECMIVDYCYACPKQFYSETRNLEKTCDHICRIAQILYKRDMLKKNNSENVADDLQDHILCTEGE